MITITISERDKKQQQGESINTIDTVKSINTKIIMHTITPKSLNPL